MRAGLLTSLLLVLALLAGCGAVPDDAAPASGVVVEDDGLAGTVLDDPYSWASVELTDTSGEPFDTGERLDAPLTMVFFGYTQCPDICQIVMANLTAARARLSAEQAGQVDVWFVTTDPDRDDPATLGEDLTRFDEDYVGLTGDLRQVLALADPVHVPIEEGRRLPSGGYEVEHGTPVLGVLPDGTVPYVWTEGTSAGDLAGDIETVLEGDLP